MTADQGMILCSATIMKNYFSVVSWKSTHNYFTFIVGLASVVESSILPSWIHVHNFLWIHHIRKLILTTHKDLDLLVLLDNNNRGEGRRL